MTTLHPNLARAFDLGYEIVPWYRATVAAKPRPCVTGWADNRPKREEFEAGRFKDKDYAVFIPFGIVVLDIENKPGKEDGFAQLRILEARYGTLPDVGPRTKTKNNGAHLWFRCGDNYPRCHIDSALEIKPFRSTCHIPPSVGYEWVRPLVAKGDLPLAPPWLMGEWHKATAKKRAAIDASVSELEMWPPGQRHDLAVALAARLRNLGLGYDGILAGLHEARATRVENPGPETLPDEELEQIAKDYAKKSVVLPAELKPAEVAEEFVVLEEEDPTTAMAASGALPEHALPYEITCANPWLESWVDWNKLALRRQPNLAMLAAACFAAHLMGDKYIGPGGAIPAFYGMGLANSGFGKGFVVGQIKEAAAFCLMTETMGASDFASNRGMESEMIPRAGYILWAIDELGVMFSRWKGGDSNAMGIMKQWLQFYDGKEITTAPSKDYPDPVCFVPRATMYSTGQPKLVFNNITAEMLTSGFVGRLVILPGVDARLEDEGTDDAAECMPDRVKELLRRAREAVPLVKDARGICRIGENEAGAAWWKASVRENNEMTTGESDADMKSFIARMPGRIRKLATVAAWMRDPCSPIIGPEEYEWARAVELVSYKMIESSLRRFCHENTVDKNASKIIEVVRAHKAGVTKSEITRLTRSISRTERDNLIASLLEARELVVTVAEGEPMKYHYQGKRS